MVLQDTYGNTFPVNNAVLLNNYHSNGPHANQTQFPNSAVLLIAANTVTIEGAVCSQVRVTSLCHQFILKQRRVSGQQY
jgi:hypothetical protein